MNGYLFFGKTSFPASARLKINLFRRLHHSAAVPFYFLQANQIVECQSIKSVGVAEFSIFLSISSRRRDLVSSRFFDHGLLEHLLVVCCFR